MATDKEIIEDYFLKDNGKWALTVRQICLANHISNTWLYKILKRNNFLTRDRKTTIEIDEAFENLERAIKLCKQAVHKVLIKESRI